MADILVPPGMEEIVAVVQEVVKLVPQGRVQQWTVEHATLPQFLQDTTEVVRLVRQEQLQWIDKHVVELAIPQINGRYR